MNQKALQGLKVIEFCEFVSGPYCGKLLSDMGAEVIKIEKPGLGDKARSWGPFAQDIPHPEKSGLFLFLNTNKESLTLNMDSAGGQKIFKELVYKWANVLIEDKPVKKIMQMGLSFSQLHKINPQLIMTSITPFGKSGPFSDYKGADLIASHAGSEAFGNPDEGVKDPEHEPPLKGPYHAADIMSGLTAGVCTLGAVLGRQSGIPGQYIDVSQQEAVASICRQQLAYYAVQGLTPSREWGRKKFGGFLYQAKDGYVVIWIGPHYPKVMQMLGDPEWSKEEMFANPLLRNDYIVELNQLISSWTVEHTGQEIVDLALKFGVPCSTVRSISDLVKDEQLEYRHFWQEVEHSFAGIIKYPGPPFRHSITPGRIERPAPLLGEHNEKVICEILGYDRKDLVKMRQMGVI
ncbi:MAG TPA: CoA transferase [Dehalococcoidales bacterium]|nr:CoA transferase [Dehalococcoidales bacterium]